MTESNKGIMVRVNARKIKAEGDPSVDSFLNSKGYSTRRAYRGDIRKFILFTYETERDYHTFGEFLNRIEKEKQLNLDREPASRRYYGEEEIQAYINWLDENDQMAKTIKRACASILSCLRYHDMVLNKDRYNYPKTNGKNLNKKHEWNPEQIIDIISRVKSLRDKAIIACLYQSGLTISDLLDLTYSDVKEKLDDPPAIIHLTRGKTEVEYRTFFGESACFYLDQYLATRQNLSAQSPLFISEGTRINLKLRVDETTIHSVFKTLAEESKFVQINGNRNPASAHSLRTAFRTALTNKIADPLIEYWMGHKLGDIGKTYINMGDADLREEYQNAERHLRLDKTIQGKAKDITEEQGRKITMLESQMKKLEAYRDEFETRFQRRLDEIEEFNQVSNLGSRLQQAKLAFENKVPMYIGNPDIWDFENNISRLVTESDIKIMEGEYYEAFKKLSVENQRRHRPPYL